MLVLGLNDFGLDFTSVPTGFGFSHDFSHPYLFGLGPLAQSVEQRTFNPWVVGSIPTGPTFREFSEHQVIADKILCSSGYSFGS